MINLSCPECEDSREVNGAPCKSCTRNSEIEYRLINKIPLIETNSKDEIVLDMRGMLM